MHRMGNQTDAAGEGRGRLRTMPGRGEETHASHG